jgi:mannose-1-phosphate guanylyltransferase
LHTIDRAFEELLVEIHEKFTAGKHKWNTVEEQDFINEMYPTCPNISIDYGIMEKAPNVYVLCADFGWSDLGTWGSLYDVSKKDEQRNVSLKCEAVFYESERNIVALSDDRLVVVQGLNDYIIAESDNVLLICEKSEEQRIRQFVNDVSVKFDGKYN